MGDTVLFDYWRSSASYRVRIALNLCGETYRTTTVDLADGQQRTAAHLDRNPQGFVPVLDIDGLRLTQSLAIIDYLGNTRALRLLPDDPGERAKATALAHAVAVDIHPVCNLRVARHATQLANDQSGGQDSALGAWMQRFIRPGLQAVETLLGGFRQSPFCCGSTPGLADICLVPQLYNARRWGVELNDLPRILSVEEACGALPEFAAAHPDRCKPD